MTDRKTVLWGITDTEDRVFLSHVCDRCDLSCKTQTVMYTRFLTPRQALLVGERLGGICDIRFYGGFDGAERCIAAFVPNEWEELCYPICALKVDNLSKRALSHRDYLGSILALGISRELIGDIVVSDEGAVVMLCRDIADFVMMNLSKVGSVGIRLSVMKDTDTLGIEKSFKDTSGTVSSMRLDCVVSAALGKSRTGAAALITDGLVNVNYNAVKNVSYTVKDGDVISVRGFGKMIVETDLALTKKGRVHINIRKYI